jgi:hypothetical protein
MREAIDAATILITPGVWSGEMVPMAYIGLQNNLAERWILTLIRNYCGNNAVKCIERGLGNNLVL